MGFYVSDSDGRYVIGTVTPAEIPALPPLMVVICPSCDGEGEVEAVDGDEDVTVSCPDCFGMGSRDVCSGCLQEPVVVAGLEVCGCSR